MKQTIAVIAILFATIIFWPQSAQAGFNNGVESFPGTVKDTSTWGSSGGNHLTQNNALFYDGGGATSTYSSINQTASWGQAAKTMVTLTTSNGGPSSGAGIFLTNNSAGPNATVTSNTEFWVFYLNWDLNTAANKVQLGTGTSGGWNEPLQGIFTYKPVLNHKYGLEILPTSTDSAIFNLYDSDGLTLIESHSYMDMDANIPNNMHISLVGIRGAATFSSVAVVPEPSIVFLTLTSLGLIAFKSRKRAKQQHNGS